MTTLFRCGGGSLSLCAFGQMLGVDALLANEILVAKYDLVDTVASSLLAQRQCELCERFVWPVARVFFVNHPQRKSRRENKRQNYSIIVATLRSQSDEIGFDFFEAKSVRTTLTDRQQKKQQRKTYLVRQFEFLESRVLGQRRQQCLDAVARNVVRLEIHDFD